MSLAPARGPGARAAVVLTAVLAGAAGPSPHAAGRAAARHGPLASAGPAARVPFGPPDSVRPSDFVGAEACRGCHPARYAAWSRSAHGGAGGEPSARTVVAPFDGRPLRFADAVVVPRRTDAGGYVFDLRWGEGADAGLAGTVTRHRLRVTGVVGRGHMVGGGTQGFFSRRSDGTLRFLPFDYSVTDGRWFCNTSGGDTPGPAEGGWVPVSPEVRLGACFDWPPIRTMGSVDRFQNCQQCHGSQIRVEVRAGRPHFATRYRSLRVNCESCHGPGRRHVELAETGRLGAAPGAGGGAGGADGRQPPGPGLDPLTLRDGDASLRVCFRCHALKTPLRGAEAYLPGQELAARFSLAFPMLGGDPYLPDGRTATFAYQGGHRFSDCYVSGTMTCADCHAPHGDGYRDAFGRGLEGPFDDGQCTACHAARAADAGQHTHHPPGSAGSRCVACHMPYLQQPRVGDAVTYGRADHTIAVPRPAADAGLGVEGACAGCHADRTSAELERTAKRWWGELRPPDAMTEALVAFGAGAPWASEPGPAATRLLRPERGRRTPSGTPWPGEAGEPPASRAARFQGLAAWVERFLAPETGVGGSGRSPPEAAATRLADLARDADPEIRSLALAALRFEGADAEIRDVPEAAIPGTGERQAAALAFLGERWAGRERWDEALRAYDLALNVRPGAPAIHFGRGRALAAAGRLDDAVTAYRRSLDLEPRRAVVWVNLGVAEAGRGRPEAAREAYRRALEVNPDEPLAHARLGGLRLEGGDADGAARAFRRSVELDAGLVEGHVGLVRALAVAGRYREALVAARRAARVAPADPTLQALTRKLERTVRP